MPVGLRPPASQGGGTAASLACHPLAPTKPLLCRMPTARLFTTTLWRRSARRPSPSAAPMGITTSSPRVRRPGCAGMAPGYRVPSMLPTRATPVAARATLPWRIAETAGQGWSLSVSPARRHPPCVLPPCRRPACPARRRRPDDAHHNRDLLRLHAALPVKLRGGALREER